MVIARPERMVAARRAIAVRHVVRHPRVFQPIKHAARYLTEAGARVIGVIVNDVDFGSRNHFSQYDYHYRYAYRYTSRYGAYGQNKKIDSKTSQPVGGADKMTVDEDDLTPSGTAGRPDAVDVSMMDDE